MSMYIQIENSKCGLQECLWNVDGVLLKNSHEQLGMYFQINQYHNLIKAWFTHNKIHTFLVHSSDEFGQNVFTHGATTIINYSHECMLRHSVVSDSLVTPWTVALQAPLSMKISQTRIPEWVTISSSRRSSWPRHWNWVFCIGRQVLYHWATWEAPVTGIPCFIMRCLIVL